MTSELAFRAQVILREQRELYSYWRACAQSRPIPSRFDIDPVAIPHLLPGLTLIDARGDLDQFRYRLAGTRVAEIYGAEITGRAVFEIGFQNKKDYWRSVYSKVVNEQMPMQGAVRGPVVGREHLVLLWLRLPLSGFSDAVERILGYDAALPSSLTLAPAKPVLAGRTFRRDKRAKI